MGTAFPFGLDTFVNPTALNPPTAPPHHQQHGDANDAIEAIEAKVGIDGSLATSSLDYIVRNNLLRKDGTVVSGADQDLGNHKIVNLASPTGAFDAATKQYVDIQDAATLTSANLYTNTFTGVRVLGIVSAPGGTNVLTFSGIPGGLSALRIIGIARSTSNPGSIVTEPLCLRFNSDSANNYSYQRFLNRGGATAPGGGTGIGQCNVADLVTASDTPFFGTGVEILIPYYDNPTFMHMLMSWESTPCSLSNIYQATFSGVWANQASITQIDLLLLTGNFVAGSIFTLYGMV